MTATVVGRLGPPPARRGERAPRKTAGAALLAGGAVVSPALVATVLLVGLDGATPAMRAALCATACFWTAGVNLGVVLACVRTLRTGRGAYSAHRSTLPRAVPGATVRRYTRVT